MKSLTSGERFIRCLTGEDIDRIPFGGWLGWMPWDEGLEKWQKESGIPDLKVGEYFGYDRLFALPKADWGLFPAFEEVIISEEGENVVFRDTKGIVKRGRKDKLSMPEFLEHPVKTPADWEQIKAERLNPAAPGRITQDWDKFRARLARTGEHTRVGKFPYGVFGTVRDLLGVENFLTGFYDHPEMVRDMMNHLTGLWLSLWEKVAKEVQIDHIHIWEDMSGKQGSLISPAMVEEFMMPCYDRIADFAQAHGVRLMSVDTDGNCAELVPLMMKHGVNAFLPFEVQAGNDIQEYRKRYPDLGIMGGLDKRALAKGKKEMDREVEKAAEMVAKGRYAPAFDHGIPPDVPWENFAYAANALKKVCYGTS